MFKKLGKKQLLGLLTAAAITVTTVGSFAVWDTLSANTNGTLTLDKPITVSATGGETFAAGTRILGSENTYTSDVTFAVENKVDNTQLTLTPKITIGTDDSLKDVTQQFNIVISQNSTEIPDNTDTTVDATNTYSVAITPNESASDDVINAAKAGNNLDVSITGILEEKATPAS